ncbi:MAG: transporter [Gammaproteobacteria bacterium]|nr:transporter [Gammaproteobacteria bacterium]
MRAYLFVFGLLICTRGALAQTEAQLTMGADYSQGDYGLSGRTDIIALPFRIKISKAPVAVSLAGSQLLVRTPGALVAGTPIGNTAARSSTSGVGDLHLTFTRNLDPLAGWYLDASARVKIPTASFDKGLGTGKFDYTLLLDGFAPIGHWLPFASLGYQITGRRATLRLRNALRGSLGVARQIGAHSQGAISIDYRAATSRSATDSLEVIPSFSIKMHKDWTLGTYGVIGLSDGSPDFAAGVQLSWRQLLPH